MENETQHEQILCRLGNLEKDMAELKKNSDELIAIFTSSRKVISGIGHIAGWTAKLGTAIIVMIAIYLSIKTGSLPDSISIP